MNRSRGEKPMYVRLLYINLLFLCVYAHRPDYEVKKWQENKFWWWSSEAPMTKALDEIPELVNGMKLILDHFERVEHRILSTFENHQQMVDDNLLRPCQCKGPKKHQWSRAVRSNFGIRGLPEPDLSCVTDFKGVRFTTDEALPYTVDQLYDAILRRGLAIKANIKSITSRFIDIKTNFTDPDFVFNYPYETTTVSCVLHPAGAVRVGDHWRLGTGIHSRPLMKGLPFFGRRNIMEFSRVVDDHLTDNLLMRLPERPENGTERVFHNDTTTIIISAKGRAKASFFRFVPIEENPAIVEILGKARRSIQQVENAVIPSNIAIFVLPLVLNLVPISLFVHVSIVKLIPYMLVSNVVTVVPLLLRGIELIRISSRRHRSIFTRLSSEFSSTRSEAAAAEMWAAECRVGGGARALGIVFLSLSLGFLLGGILLELIARACMQRRNLRLRKLVESRIKSAAGKREDFEKPPQPSGVKEDGVEPANSTISSRGEEDLDAQGVGGDRIERTSNESNLRQRRGRQDS